MKNKQLMLPNQETHDYGYGLAYRLACEQLAGIDDIEQQCLKSGAQYIDSQKAIAIEFFNQPHLITLADTDVSLLTGDETVPARDKLLILHYFTYAKGTPLSNQKITYKELPEGLNYFPTFYKRAIRPLVNYFSKDPQQLLDIAGILGGYKTDYGDAAVTINAFRQVPITLVLWKGDEEFTPEGSIMFDSTITDYLPTEDITILCEITAWRLVKLLKTRGDSPDRN